MTTGYKIFDQSALYFMTLQVVQWADIFTRKVYRDIIIDGFRYCCDKKGLEIYAYVIMSNHIHLLAQSTKGDISGTIRDFKRHTAKQILNIVQDNSESRRHWMMMIFRYAARGHNRNKTFQVWTHENHAELIYSNKFIEQKIEYIHNNPVRAGLVEKPEDYLYSSARCYAELDAVFQTELAVLRWKTVR
ncbi:MAG: transposase [Flavobacteriales bacterium]|nr:transposase [Flavobacteriales bacterium]